MYCYLIYEGVGSAQRIIDSGYTNTYKEAKEMAEKKLAGIKNRYKHIEILEEYAPGCYCSIKQSAAV